MTEAWCPAPLSSGEEIESRLNVLWVYKGSTSPARRRFAMPSSLFFASASRLRHAQLFAIRNS